MSIRPPAFSDSAKPIDILCQVPVIFRVGITRHQCRCDDDIFAEHLLDRSGEDFVCVRVERRNRRRLQRLIEVFEDDLAGGGAGRVARYGAPGVEGKVKIA
jgi:hypothetical protein